MKERERNGECNVGEMKEERAGSTTGGAISAAFHLMIGASAGCPAKRAIADCWQLPKTLRHCNRGHG